MLPATFGDAMPRNSGDVPRNASASRLTEDGGKKRSERLRARRDEAGLAQVSGWVSKDRRPYAREVLAALAQSANSLPPDPEQAATLKAAQAALEAAQAEAAAARMEEALASEALVRAQQHEQVLAAELGIIRVELDATCAELDAARTEIETARGGARQAEAAALAQVEAAKATAALALAAAERFQKAPGLRGRAVRWLVR
jgi:ribonuclease D